MRQTTKWDSYVGYFAQQVLSGYRDESEKWVVENDFFEGRVTCRSDYYEGLNEADRDRQYIEIRFGFRTLASGELAVAAWLPDLVEKSKGHLDRWRGFHLGGPQWATEDDRFELWGRRYIEGDWDVEDGVRAQLAELVETCRGLTGAVLGVPLFKHAIPASLPFPRAQNTHCYQDAHSDLYRYLIDGLDKACLRKLAVRQGKAINIESENTVKALQALLPTLDLGGPFKRALDVISSQRRLSDHNVRPPAEPFRAFEAFTKDLELAAEGLKELIAVLEVECGANAKRAARRWEAMTNRPQIGRPAHRDSSVHQADRIVGKTVERVEYGVRREIEGVNQSEILVAYFTDGSIASIDSYCNAAQLFGQDSEFKASDVHVDFHIDWVPPLQP